MRRLLLAIVFGVAVLALGSGTAASQTTLGMIEGRVTDSTGGILPGATVTVTNTRTAATRVVVTNEEGLFRAANLNPSDYTIRVELAGFRTVVRQGVTLGVSETLDIGFKLELESVAEQVTVTGESPLVSTIRGEIGQKIESRRVVDLPVNSRDFTRLALLAPGARMVTSGVADMMFNGTDQAQNNFLLDGTDATMVENAFLSNGRERGARLQTASSESVQEFRVLSSNYSAEYGRAAGAVVTAITKSGSNTFSGSGYFFLRDDSLDARNFFDPPQKPDFKLKQFGASLGGPIRRDRVFFFGNYEGSRKHLGSSQTQTVPSASFRTRVDPALAAILRVIPLPTEPTANPNVGIFRTAGVTNVIEDIMSARLDFRPTNNDTLFGRFNLQQADVGGPLHVLYAQDVAGQQQYAPATTVSATISYLRTLHANLMNELKFGFNQNHFRLNQYDGNTSLADLLTPEAKTIPQVTITGVDVRAGNLMFNERTGTGFEIIDNVTWFKGSHSIKMGVNVRRKQTKVFQAGYPTMSFASLNDFAANRPQNATLRDDAGPGIVFGWEYGVYVQDDIKATSRLAVNLGVRYDYEQPYRATAGTKVANFDLETLTLVTEAPFYAADRNDIAPRVGVTYDLTGDGRTILGGGYGLYYQPYPLQSFFGQVLTANAIQTTTLNRTTNPDLRYPLPSFAGGMVLPQNRSAVNPSMRTNYNHQFTVNVQRQLGSSTSAQVGYVGNRTRNGGRSKPGNLVDPSLGRRPFPQFAQFTVATYTGTGQFDALQVLLNRRLSKGLSFNAIYSYSRFMDDLASPQAPCSNYLDFESCANWDLEWSRSTLDAPHNLSFNAIWQIPLGERQGVSGALLTGWQLTSIVLARSGYPYTVNLGTTRSGTGWFTNQRPNLVPGVPTVGNKQGPTGWLNLAAFSDVEAGKYGNLSRNTERGPNLVQIDASLLKNFQLRGTQRLQVRFEVFNVVNKPIWAIAPSSTWLSPASFGRIANTFGKTESFGTARQIQLGVRYDF